MIRLLTLTTAAAALLALPAAAQSQSQSGGSSGSESSAEQPPLSEETSAEGADDALMTGTQSSLLASEPRAGTVMGTLGVDIVRWEVDRENSGWERAETGFTAVVYATPSSSNSTTQSPGPIRIELRADDAATEVGVIEGVIQLGEGDQMINADINGGLDLQILTSGTDGDQLSLRGTFLAELTEEGTSTGPATTLDGSFDALLQRVDGEDGGGEGS